MLEAALVALLGALVFAVPARSDSVIAREAAWTSISALDGRVVWSSLQPGTGYVLKSRYRGRTSDLPVAPRRVPFDVDLGRDAKGRLVAAYSRCQPETDAPQGISEPGYAAGKNCDIHLFSFANRIERKVPLASRVSFNEFRPSVGDNRLAFLRVSTTSSRARRYFAPLGSRGRLQRLDVVSPRLDLRGNLLAYQDADDAELCSKTVTDRDSNWTQIWLQRTGSRPRKIAEFCEDINTSGSVSHPVLTAHSLFYVAEGPGQRWAIRRYDLRRRVTYEARLRLPQPDRRIRGAVAWLARDRSGTYYARRDLTSPEPLGFEIVRAEPLKYRRVKRPAMRPT